MDPTLQPQNQNDTPASNGLDLDSPVTSADSTTPVNSATSADSTTSVNSASSFTSATSTTPTTSATSATPTTSTIPTTPVTSDTSFASSTSAVSSTSDSGTPAMGGAELDSLMNELNNYQPENDTANLGSMANSTTTSTTTNPTTSTPSSSNPTSDRPQFSPSENLTQTSTTSASIQGQTDQNLNLSSDFNTSGLGGDLSGVSLSEANSSDSVSATNPTTSSSASSATGVIEPDEEDGEDKPLTAAAPVPGSIGSAVSYADVEKKQAEEAAKQAKNQNKPKIKFTRTTILAMVVGGLVVITAIVFAIIFLTAPKKKPSEATGKNNVAQAESKSLTCVRPLSTNEVAEVNAGYGNFERQFNFINDTLESITENYVYQFNSADAATAAKTTIDAASAGSDITTTVNVNQLQKTTKITTEKLDNYLKGVAELNSVTNRDLNGFLAAENQTGLSCSTIE